jgi:hypothetical protein
MAPIRSRFWIVCAGFALLGIGGSPASPQQSESSKDQTETKKVAWLHENYLREASEYDFFLDEPKRKKLELRPEPVMRWSSSGDYNGEVYVWTYQGSAAVVGCIFSGPSGKTGRSIFHEFHSLAPNPLHAGKNGGSRWLPDEPGIKLESIPDAPEPAMNQARRLTQMRELARRFTSQVERENVRSEMRLLPQPIYRYEITDEKSPVVDGAVFAFVWTAGTDPEVLIVLEARRTDQEVRWHYAAARFTNREAWLKYQDREVWRAAPATVGIFDGVTTKPYGAFSVKTIANQAAEK